MLSERSYELLTAYVDGELGARQRKMVLRLLHRSAEARSLLRQLQEDAESLRRLPRLRLGPDFSERVLQAIGDQRVVVSRPLPRPQARPVPAWAGLAMAASLLLLVGFGSFLYFAGTFADHTTGPVADGGATAPDNGDRQPADPVRVVDNEKKDGSESGKNGKQPEPSRQPDQVAEVPRESPEPAKEVPVPADNGPETTLAIPIPEKEMFQPREAAVALPLILKFADLNAGKLRDELQKDSGFRLEVPCRDSARAFERWQAVFKAQGIALVIDQVAQARLKYPHLQTNYILYAEDLLPDELARILQQVGGEGKKRGDSIFNGLVVTHMNKDDRKELSSLLGVDPKQVQNQRPTGPLGVDPRKPLAETTGDRVAQALAGQGTAKGPRAPEHLALALAYNPVRPRPGSAEVKRFLDSRKAARGGSIQVLLVLREMKR